MFAALPCTHPLAGEASIELGSLADAPWIAAPLAGLPLAALRDVAHRAGFHPKLQFEGDDFRTVLALVAHGLGIALLPRLALDAVPDTIAIRPLAEAPMTRYLYVSRLRTRTTPAAVAALVEAIRSSA